MIRRKKRFDFPSEKQYQGNPDRTEANKQSYIVEKGRLPVRYVRAIRPRFLHSQLRNNFPYRDHLPIDSDRVFDIAFYDILLVEKASLKSLKSAKNQKDLRKEPEVIPCANGLYIDNDVTEGSLCNNNSIYDQIYKKYHFYGIANYGTSGPFPFDSSMATKTQNGVSVLAGGSTQMINSGPDELEAGDLICWDVPRIEELNTRQLPGPTSGQDKKKQPIICRKYDSVKKFSVENILQKLLEKNGDNYKMSGNLDGKINYSNLDVDCITMARLFKDMCNELCNNQIPDINENLKNKISLFFHCYSELLDKQKSRVFAKVQHGGLSGDQIEVIVGNSMYN